MLQEYIDAVKAATQRVVDLTDQLMRALPEWSLAPVVDALVARFGDRIVTSLKGNYLSTALEWDFVSNEQGFLGGLVGVKYFDVDTVMVTVSPD